MESSDRSRATSAAIRELSAERLRAWRYDAGIDVLLITDGKPHVTIGTEVSQGVVILKDVGSGRPVGLRIMGLAAYLRSPWRTQGSYAGSEDRRAGSAHDLIEMAVRVTGLELSEPGPRVIGTHERVGECMSAGLRPWRR